MRTSTFKLSFFLLEDTLRDVLKAGRHAALKCARCYGVQIVDVCMLSDVFLS